MFQIQNEPQKIRPKKQVFVLPPKSPPKDKVMSRKKIEGSTQLPVTYYKPVSRAQIEGTQAAADGEKSIATQFLDYLKSFF